MASRCSSLCTVVSHLVGHSLGAFGSYPPYQCSLGIMNCSQSRLCELHRTHNIHGHSDVIAAWANRVCHHFADVECTSSASSCNFRCMQRYTASNSRSLCIKHPTQEVFVVVKHKTQEVSVVVLHFIACQFYQQLLCHNCILPLYVLPWFSFIQLSAASVHSRCIL